MSCPLQGMVVNIYRILRVCLVLVFKNFSYYSVAFSYCCTETSYQNLVMCDVFIVLVQDVPMRVLLPDQGWSHLCGLALLATPLGDPVILCVSPDVGRPAWPHSHGRSSRTHVAQGYFEAQARNSSSIIFTVFN